MRKGFSLIELIIVIAISGIILGAVSPVFVKQIEVRAARKCAEEVRLIQNMALKYYVDNGGFPADIRTLQDAGLLNPAWDGKNPFGHDYSLSSDGYKFSVSTEMPAGGRAVAAAELPKSIKDSGSADSFVLISSVTAPGQIDFGRFVLRSDSGGPDSTTMIDELFVPEVRSPTDTHYRSNFEDGKGEIKDIYVKSAGKWLSEIRPTVTEAEEVVVQTVVHRLPNPTPPPQRRTAHRRETRRVTWEHVSIGAFGWVLRWRVNGNVVATDTISSIGHPFWGTPHHYSFTATAPGSRTSGRASGAITTGSSAHGSNGWRGSFRVGGFHPPGYSLGGSGGYDHVVEVWTEWWE